VSLKPDLFEGLKFDFSKPLNMNFAVTHRYAFVPTARHAMQYAIQELEHCNVFTASIWGMLKCPWVGLAQH